MKLRQSILAALLTACTASSHAQVTSGATIGYLSYTLFDLDLSDANTPSLLLSIPEGVVQPPSTRLGYTSLAYREQIGGRTVLSQEGNTLYQATSQATLWDGNAGMAIASLSSRHIPFRGQSLGQYVEIGAVPGAQAQVTLNSASDAVYFMLSPGAAVTFNATFSGWAQIAPDENYYGMAEILGSLTVRTVGDPNNDVASDARLYSTGAEPGMPQDFDELVYLSVSYQNTGDDPFYGYVQMNLQGAASTTPVSMVPEPGQLPMLLAGFLLLPLAARKVATLSAGSTRRR
jgi:hypothetical protein